MLKNDVLTVARHKNIANWLKSKGIEGKVVEVARPKDVFGKKVYGVLPFYMAAMCDEFYHIHVNTSGEVDFDDIPYEDFDKLGVEVKKYIVQCDKVKL